MPLLITQMWGFGNKMRAMFWTKCSWGFPNLLRITAPMGRNRGPQDVKYILKKKSPRNFWKCLVTIAEINTGLTGLCCYYRQVYCTWVWVSYAAVCLCMSVLFTCFLVSLLVWPDDRAEVGEDQCTQSAGSFLWSTVVVKGVLAQHKPVPALLNPGSPHFPQ